MENHNWKLKIFIFAIAFLIVPNFSQAAISFTNGKWENSFACSDWVADYPSTFNCNGLAIGGNWCAAASGGVPCAGTDQSRGESILAAYNNPLGQAGTAAQVHYFWTGVDGLGSSNKASGGISVYYPQLLQEFWFRSYVYYPREMGWGIANGWKTIYFDHVSTPGWYFDFPQNTGTGFYFQTKDANGNNIGYVTSAGYGDEWLESNNRQGFGRWIPVEIHAKNDTDSTDGILQTWIDGTLILDKHDQNFGVPGFSEILVGSNGNAAVAAEPSAINKAVPILFDDQVIYNTTPPNRDMQNNPFIGPIGWAGVGDSAAPSAPSGLAVQ